MDAKKKTPAPYIRTFKMPSEADIAKWKNKKHIDAQRDEVAKRIVDKGKAGATEAESYFTNAVEQCDKYLMRRGLDVIEATGAQTGAFQRVAQLTAGHDIRKAFRSFWDVYGWTIRLKVADDAAVCDALWNLVASYDGPSMTLYRGELAAQHEMGIYGISWTTDIEVGRMFAGGRNCEPPDGGVVVESLVPAEAIISLPSRHSKYLQEYEVIVDPRGLNEVRALERFSSD